MTQVTSTGERMALAALRIVVALDGPPLERLAAAEVQRYLAHLCGTVPPLRDSLPEEGPAVLIGGVAERYARTAGLGVPTEQQEITIHTTRADGDVRHLVMGGSPAATQWAAYRLLETLGCGFYLGGDALPETDPRRTIGDVNVHERPAFAVRGTLPWYNFLNGPTAWNPQDHRRFYDQLAKQGANFVGYHSYDWEPWAAYPMDFMGQTRMIGGEPAATTGAVHRRDIWGVSTVPVEEYAFGTDALFGRGLFGADVALDWRTHDEGIREAQAMLASSLRYARARGIRTCVGFEVSGDPVNPASEEALRARVAHMVATYPLDYLWLWQAENRGSAVLSDVGDPADREWADTFAYLGRPDRVAEGVRMAHYVVLGHRLLAEIAPDVRLIVSGWGGDQHMRFTDFYQGLHVVTPRDVIFSALDNIDPTAAPTVSAVYEGIARERECWPIPWFESDAGGTRRDQWGPQPNVHAFAPLIDDAERKGCAGILGIHWRTRAIEEVAGYTFRRAWETTLAPPSFFKRFAAASYGEATGAEMATIHVRLEELGPRWTGAAGQVECRGFEWFATAGLRLLDSDDAPPTLYRNRRLPDGARTEELARLRTRVAALACGATESRAERYAYLLAQMRWVAAYDAAALHLYDGSDLERILREGESLVAQGKKAQARGAGEDALARIAGSGLREAIQEYATSVTNQGEVGVVAVINGKAVVAYKALLRRAEVLAGRPAPEALAGSPWPDDPVILTPERFDVAFADAATDVRIIVLARDAPASVEACVAAFGARSPAAISPLVHRRRGVYSGCAPVGAGHGPAMCWIRVTTETGAMTESDRWSMSRIPMSLAVE